MEVVVLKVSSNTDPMAAATSITKHILNGKRVLVDVIGVAANYVCIKAFIQAKSNLEANGIRLFITVDFVDLQVDKEKIKTGIRWCTYILKEKK